MVPETELTMVPAGMPKPVTDIPGTIPGALAALTVTVVAAAVTETEA